MADGLIKDIKNLDTQVRMSYSSLITKMYAGYTVSPGNVVPPRKLFLVRPSCMLLLCSPCVRPCEPKAIDGVLRVFAENRRPLARIRVTDRRGHVDLAINDVRTFTGLCAGDAANDSNSSKVYRRESCLASVQIKPESSPRYAKVLCLIYLSLV